MSSDSTLYAVLVILGFAVVVFSVAAFCFWMAFRNLKKLMDELKNNK